MKRIFIVISLLAVAASALPRESLLEADSSARPRWHKIGETTVDFKQDRDEVDVVGINKFTRIKFRILDEPIDLVEAYVVYATGEDQKITVSAHIKAAGDSKEFDLTGGTRVIKKIGFVYKTLPNVTNKKAHIEVWGFGTN
jgi:ribosomal protein L18E